MSTIPKIGYLYYFYYDAFNNDGSKESAQKADYDELHKALNAEKIKRQLYGYTDGSGAAHSGAASGYFNSVVKPSMVSNGSLDEFADTIDQFSLLDGETIMEPSSETATKQSFTEGYGNASKIDFSSMSVMNEVMKKADTLADTISNFAAILKTNIAKMEDIIGSNIAAAETELVESFCNQYGVSSLDSNWKQTFYSNFVKHEGLRRWDPSVVSGVSGSKLDKCLAELVVLANALPELGETGGVIKGKYSTSGSIKAGKKNGTTGEHFLNEENVFYIIAKKVQGLWSNVTGEAGEIAAIAGAANAFIEAQEKLGNIVEQSIAPNGTEKILASSNGMKVSVRQSGSEQKEKIDTGTKVVSKPDVEITIEKNGVVIKYGASVKNYKQTKSSGGTRPVSLVDNTPFWEALEKHTTVPQQYGVLQLAAGHEGTVSTDSKEGPNVKRKRKIKGMGVSKEQMNEQWRDIVGSVVLLNALDALIGVETTEGYRNLYYIKNGQVFRMEQVLQKIAKDEAVFQGNALKEEGGLLQRGTMMKQNEWVESKTGYYNTAASYKRSSAAKSAIMSTLRSAKLRISLNWLLN